MEHNNTSNTDWRSTFLYKIITFKIKMLQNSPNCGRSNPLENFWFQISFDFYMVHIQYGPVIWTTDGPSVMVSYKIGMWSFSSQHLYLKQKGPKIILFWCLDLEFLSRSIGVLIFFDLQSRFKTRVNHRMRWEFHQVLMTFLIEYQFEVY